MGKTLNLEKNTQLVLGIIGLTALLIYILNSVNLGEWSPNIFIVTGIALFLILIIEGGVATYFKAGRYKSLDVGDVIIWATMVVAGLVLLNTLIGFQAVANLMPQSVIDFAGTSSAIVAGFAGVIVVIQMITPRFKG